MRKATQSHEKAMKLAEEADLAQVAQDLISAKRLFAEAFRLERDAALQFLKKIEVEPTRSVLFRSAASLAIEAGEYIEAERMICHGLAAEPPIDTRIELRQLYEQMHFRLFLNDAGLQLAEGQVVVTLWGPQIAPGFAACREVVRRLQKSERLIYRTAERKSGLPYKDSDEPPDEIRRNFKVYASLPEAASYAIVLRVAEAQRQLTFPFSIDAAGVVSELLDCMELYNSERGVELRQHIGDMAYLRNFLGLARGLYPSTPDVAYVGFAGVTGRREPKVIELREPPKLDIRTEQEIPADAEATPRQIKGFLYAARSTARIRRIELRDERGGSHEIDVPEGMMADVVRPHFESMVTVEVLEFPDNRMQLTGVSA